MQFALYELALNPSLQRKAQEEIDRVLQNHNQQVTYEALQEMEYVECVVNGEYLYSFILLQQQTYLIEWIILVKTIFFLKKVEL